MNLRIAYRGTIGRTDQLDEHVRKQLAKIMKFLEREHGPATIDVVLEGHPNHAHNSARLHIVTPMFEVVALREAKNIYSVIDKVADIAYDELHRQKEKIVHEKKNRGSHRLD